MLSFAFGMPRAVALASGLAPPRRAAGTLAVMSIDTEPENSPGAPSAGRPRAVDLALYAILLRCVLALAAAFALFGAKDEVRRNAAKLHPEWSAATLADRVDSQLRSNVVVTVVYIVLVLLIAKFIRDGRNWARWLYTVVAFLVAGDVLRITGFFTGENVAFRMLSGLTGVAAVVAIVLLFSPAAREYFRPAPGAGRVSPLQALFGGRTAVVAAARNAADRNAGDRNAADGGAGTHPGAGEPARVSAAKPVSLDKAAAGVAGQRGSRPAAGRGVTGLRPPGGRRPAPRAKSRKQAAE